MFRSRALTGVCLCLAVGLLSGCVPVPPAEVGSFAKGFQDGAARQAGGSGSLTFEYVPENPEPNTISQTLEIYHTGTDTVAPVLRLTALDEAGDPVPGVTVDAIYGSDEGGLVVPPGGGYDVLRFAGADTARVVDVAVSVVSAAPVAFPVVHEEAYVEITDEYDEEVPASDRFTYVHVYNDNAERVTVRVVYIVWDVPAPGRTQQAIAVAPIRGLRTIAPGSGERLTVIDEARELNESYAGTRPASVKVYFSH